MCSVTLFVGLDYSEDVLQLCCLDCDGAVIRNKPCANNWRSVAAFVGQKRDVRVAIEACCGAANLAEELSNQLGWSVSLAHPGYVARLKQSPDKSDFSDARLLADLVRVGYLPKVWLAPEKIRELRRLVRFRQQLVENRRDVKLRIRALLRDNRIRASRGVNAWTRSWFEWMNQVELGTESRWVMNRQLARLDYLTEELKAVEHHLAEVGGNDALVLKLMSFQGIGFITAVTLRAEIGRFDRFATGKQLSRFIGLSPRNASSGNRVADAGLIKAGNPKLRATVIETAQRLIMFDPKWRKLATELDRRGKPRCVTVAAVANRWIRWLYHQMKLEEIAA